MITHNCEDCGIGIHEESNHTGYKRWCEDCFAKGLSKDTKEHWKDYIEKRFKDWDGENFLKMIERENGDVDLIFYAQCVVQIDVDTPTGKPK